MILTIVITYVKAVELVFNQSYGVHIMPLVINSLRGGDTHTHTHTHIHTDIHTESILRNQAYAWFKKLYTTQVTAK